MQMRKLRITLRFLAQAAEQKMGHSMRWGCNGQPGDKESEWNWARVKDVEWESVSVIYDSNNAVEQTAPNLSRL